jgi:glycerol-3-phosphate acyltransferase PlsY
MLARDLVAIIAGYFLGAIPFAHLVTKLRTGRNIRHVGDGNAGARNVWHVVSPVAGAIVTVLDGLKGIAAVLLARALGASLTGELLTGPMAMVGHCFPVWLRFQGGKGVATLAGIALLWAPWSTITALSIVGVSQLFLRNMDRAIPIGAISGIFLPPVFGYPWTMTVYILALFVLVGLKKLLDLPHERQVWSQSGWKDVGQNDWYPGVQAGQEQGEDTTAAPAHKNGGLPPETNGVQNHH